MAIKMKPESTFSKSSIILGALEPPLVLRGWAVGPLMRKKEITQKLPENGGYFLGTTYRGIYGHLYRGYLMMRCDL